MNGPIRFSHLRAFGKSAAHGLHAMSATDDDPTYAMERGTAVHAMLFGTAKIIGYPGPTRRGKEYDKFEAEHPGYQILTMNEYDKARRMVDAVQGCALAQPYLKGVVEETILFRWMGLDCRSTPDVRGAEFVTELKTAPSADPDHFNWHALKMMYHAQMRLEQIASQTAKDCYIVCVEANEPFPVTVFRIDERTLEIGEKLLVTWAERLKVAEASQSWPGYVQCVVPISAPIDDELIFPEDGDAV